MILFIFEGKKNRAKEIREHLSKEKLTLVSNRVIIKSCGLAKIA